jgi:hypothetical protein
MYTKKLIESYREYKYNDYRLEIHESFSKKPKTIIKVFQEDEELNAMELLQTESDYSHVIFNIMCQILEDDKRNKDNRS